MSEVEVVLPAYNEAAVIADTVGRVLKFLANQDLDWNLTVIDNGSEDDTGYIAQQCGATVVRVPPPGRGRAIRTAWLNSDAEVVAYMDVDLSADLDHLSELVRPLLDGTADIAIGTRWSPKADVQRSPKRLAVSWAYNHLLQLTMGVHFTDAMCGFKAMRTDVARRLLPRVVDNEWFFDAELLILAERSGYRIHEVPLVWRDDPNSSVDIPRTAAKALAGMWRMRNARGLPALTAI
jgi:glycosyltransferase involved in cell wall biosynthesis